jgi:hypothetical protein
MSRYQFEAVGVSRLHFSPGICPFPSEPPLRDVGAVMVDDAMIIREVREAIGAGQIRRAMAWMSYLRDQPANAPESHSATRRPS